MTALKRRPGGRQGATHSEALGGKCWKRSFNTAEPVCDQDEEKSTFLDNQGFTKMSQLCIISVNTNLKKKIKKNIYVHMTCSLVLERTQNASQFLLICIPFRKRATNCTRSPRRRVQISLKAKGAGAGSGSQRCRSWGLGASVPGLSVRGSCRLCLWEQCPACLKDGTFYIIIIIKIKKIKDGTLTFPLDRDRERV